MLVGEVIAMPQVSIYLDQGTLKKVRARARADGTSVSKWVRSRIDRDVHRDWPPGYFDLCGILKDVDIERPDQGSFGQDAPREKL
jgi:hypothetical protein